MAIKTHPCICFFFPALEYTLLRWLTAIGMTSSSPTLHHSESVPHLPYWPCRNRWSLSVCSICTSGIGVRTSSVLSRGTWILAAMTVSAVPSSSMFVFMTKTGWMLWIRHHPLTQWFPLTCSWFPASLSSYAHVKVTDFLGTPYQSKFGCHCISQAGHFCFHLCILWNVFRLLCPLDHFEDSLNGCYLVYTM